MDLPRLTPAEFEIMDVIWNGSEMKVTEVMKLVNAKKDKPFSRSTIQVQMQRLAEKGWLKTRGTGKTFYYSATVKRSDATANIAEDVKERVFGGSCVEMVRSLLDHDSVSSSEIEALRELINKHSEG